MGLFPCLRSAPCQGILFSGYYRTRFTPFKMTQILYLRKLPTWTIGSRPGSILVSCFVFVLFCFCVQCYFLWTDIQRVTQSQLETILTTFDWFSSYQSKKENNFLCLIGMRLISDRQGALTVDILIEYIMNCGIFSQVLCCNQRQNICIFGSSLLLVNNPLNLLIKPCSLGPRDITSTLGCIDLYFGMIFMTLNTQAFYCQTSEKIFGRYTS